MNNRIRSYRIECTIKGRIYRPSYTGIVVVNAPENFDHDWQTLVAKRLSRESFEVDGVNPNEVIIHSMEIIE